MKFSRLYIFFTVATLLLSNVVNGQESGWTTIKFYQAIEYDFKLSKYNPPIHYVRSEIVSDHAKPFWHDAFKALFDYREYEFSEWKTFFTKEYLQLNSISERKFRLAKENVNNSMEIVTISALFAFHIRTRDDDREFCFVSYYDFDHLDAIPRNSSEVEYAIATRCFEKVDGKWKCQEIDVLPWAKYLPFSNIEKLEGMIKEEAALLNKFNQIKPFKN